MRRIIQQVGRTGTKHVSRTSRAALSSSQVNFDEQLITMPALSPTMESGTITEWLVKPGDTVEEGDELCMVETDKAIASFETMQEGVIAKILPAMKNINVGEVIAVMVDEGDDWENVKYDASASAPVESATMAPPAQMQCTTPIPVSSTKLKFAPPADNAWSFPSVRLLMAQYGIDDISKIEGTGPRNAVTKGDALHYIEQNNLQKITFVPSTKSNIQSKSTAEPTRVAAPIAATTLATPAKETIPIDTSTFKDVEITQMRSIIAKRLTESKTGIPHQYSKITCQMDAVAALRAQLKTQGVKVSVNDFIIKSVASALTKHPTINQGMKGITTEVDVSVAVATDAGLITPIVKNADQKGLSNISATVKDLATRARAKKLKPEEFMGGSFTISNLGMFGIKEFSAVINPPQVCIMAVGGNKQKFVQIDESLGAEVDNLELKNFMTVQLSSDGGKVGQSEVIAFLETFKMNMENPVNMIV